jgi:hypothetical protein
MRLLLIVGGGGGGVSAGLRSLPQFESIRNERVELAPSAFVGQLPTVVSLDHPLDSGTLFPVECFSSLSFALRSFVSRIHFDIHAHTHLLVA